MFESDQTAEPIAFCICRRTLNEAMRRWIVGEWVDPGNQRVKLAIYFNHQLIDHISTPRVEWRGQWRWSLNADSFASMGITRAPLKMIQRASPAPNARFQAPPTLGEACEWGMRSTMKNCKMVEWRLMGHILVPLVQANGASWCFTDLRLQHLG